jgi:hypothetical protein
LSVTANICVWSSEGSLVDVAEREGTWGADAVDQELTRLIEKRSSRDVDLDERDETWKESVRRHNARLQEENRQAWTAFHEQQAQRHRRTLEGLISYHETRAQRLLTEGEAWPRPR